MGGGKSRKTGQVSKKLIARLVKEHADGARKKKGKVDNDAGTKTKDTHKGFGWGERV